ncbi:hypothetical protein OG921_01005 [Aldersonia sp. NBC_00410]|uniref:hypothetical protein n=1 Tax=Aldersonia sp. NBC_00410 TaxID=2975954 RepID=UPI0022540718|nr:hypothetical protein [Aldersonia sp. NBC_00410]MCX5041769.1 hypothetical protein [Aldersonia sp. NBC_00410]
MSNDGPDGTPPIVLFAEPGARWRVAGYGPLLCLVVLIVELSTGSGVHWLTLPICAAVLAAAVSVQIVAARRHASVVLTPEVLRNGTEELPLRHIVEVFGPRDETSRQFAPWETARTLGELAEVPRRRNPIGLQLKRGRLVRAWAKDETMLRLALVAALGGTGDHWRAESAPRHDEPRREEPAPSVDEPANLPDDEAAE